MSQFLYPSDVAETTLKLKPDPALRIHHGEPEVCSHCSRDIEEGERYSPSSVGQFFSDSRDLASSSQKICWRCVHLRSMPLLYGMAATVSTPDGLYPIAKDIHKAWLFTDPPPAPFFVTVSSSTMQHLLWRTPLTLDNRYIKVRFGPDVFTIRPAMINKALQIADEINADQKQWRTPVYLDRSAQAANHGMITNYGRERLSETQIEFFQQELTRGELWALAYVMHSKRPTPNKPEPTTQVVLDKIFKKK